MQILYKIIPITQSMIFPPKERYSSHLVKLFSISQCVSLKNKILQCNFFSILYSPTLNQVWRFLKCFALVGSSSWLFCKAFRTFSPLFGCVCVFTKVSDHHCELSTRTHSLHRERSQSSNLLSWNTSEECHKAEVNLLQPSSFHHLFAVNTFAYPHVFYAFTPLRNSQQRSRLHGLF